MYRYTNCNPIFPTDSCSLVIHNITHILYMEKMIENNTSPRSISILKDELS